GIKTAKNIPVGDFVEITIHHPGASEPILQKAHVVWAKKDESGEWRLGFEFPTYNLTRFIPLMSSRREGGR
ncbi:MAG: PilZ domain-containing protein, partial [Nitrospinota bacterium]